MVGMAGLDLGFWAIAFGLMLVVAFILLVASGLSE